MRLSARARWTAYALAGLLTLAAMAWVGRNDERELVAPVVKGKPIAGQRDGAAKPKTGPVRLNPLLPRLAAAVGADPFVADDDLSADPGIQAASAAPSVPAPSTAAAMPFSYLGSWKEQGRTYVFLQRDDRSYRVAGPGKLDRDYVVQALDEHRVRLKYLPLGTVQELRLDAPTPQRPAASAPPTPAGDSDPHPDN